MMYPKVAFSGIEDFNRDTDNWKLRVIKSSNASCCMSDERAFNSWQTHNNRLQVDRIRQRMSNHTTSTFFEIFCATSLRVSEANGTGDSIELYQMIE